MISVNYRYLLPAWDSEKGVWRIMAVRDVNNLHVTGTYKTMVDVERALVEFVYLKSEQPEPKEEK